MDMSSLFPSDTNNNNGSATDDDASSQVHVSFNAGILNLDSSSKRMTADPRRGQFYIRTSLDDGLVHIQWKPCDGDVEKDLILINGETEMKQVMSCPASARVYVLKWRESDTRMFLWMQERDAGEDAARVSVVNYILENGPAAGAGGGVGGATAGGLQQFEQGVHHDEHSATQQADDNDDPMDDTTPSSSVPAATAAAATTTPASTTPPPTSRATFVATEPFSSTTTAAAATGGGADGVTTTTNAAASTAAAGDITNSGSTTGGGRSTTITLEQVRAALSGNTRLPPLSSSTTPLSPSDNTMSLLQAQALAQAQASLTPTPRDLLQSDLLAEALRDPAVVDGLKTLVDDVPPDDRTTAGVRDVLQSAELDSQAASLSAALTSGHDADDLLRGLGIDIDVAAGSGVGFGFGGFGGNSAAVLVRALKRIQRERQADGASKGGSNNEEKKEEGGN